MKEFTIALGIAFLSFSCAHVPKEKDKNRSFQIYQISEEVKFKTDLSKAKKIRMWIPIPSDTHSQKVYDISINLEDGANGYVTRESKYGNRMFYVELSSDKAEQLVKIDRPFIKIQYKVIRFKDYGEEIVRKREEYSKIKEKYLEQERMGKIDENIQKISEDVLLTSGLKKEDTQDTELVGKVFFNYVLNHMSYDKSVPGWGRGDVKRACEVGKGNCTDYHALFSALCRAVNIPVKFVIGYPIPEKVSSGELKGYHCWVYFLSDKKWIPVDISETDKKPEKNFFGYLDYNRFEISEGRDIILEPPQAGEPLNFFVYPYCEVDDKTIDCLQTDIKFEILD